MQYLLMIYRSEAEMAKMDPAARQKMTADYGEFTRSIIQSGHFKAGDAPSARTGLCVEPALVDSASAACDRRGSSDPARTCRQSSIARSGRRSLS